MLRLQSYRTVWGLVAKHVESEKLRQVLSFHPLLVGGNPFSTTSIRYQNVDGKAKVDQIRVGGTNTTLVFGSAAPTAAGIN